MIRGFRASFLLSFLGRFFSLFLPFLCRIMFGCHRSSLLGEFFCFILVFLSFFFLSPVGDLFRVLV